MGSHGAHGNRWKIIVLVVLLVVAGAVAIESRFYKSYLTTPRPVTGAFYTDDDGATTFVDDIDRITPFDHNGKPAYLARVYKSKKGATFVAWLERYTERGRKEVEGLLPRRSEGSGIEEQIRLLQASQLEVKRPNETEWVLLSTPAGTEIAGNVTCPDRSEVDSVVTP